MKIRHIITLSSAMIALAACSQKPITVSVTNPLNSPRQNATVEIDASEILARAGASHVYITDAGGNEIPSQITYDSLLIFQTDLGAGETAVFNILPSENAHSYDTVATGRLYPERADDVAWENDLVGFRAYGPATQRKNERGYGYDTFLKHKNEKPVLETLYAIELDPANWAKVDSLRKIDNKLAGEFINTFSYHVDHGLGMDCYAVGPTLGDGVAVPVVNDSLSFSWCYSDAKVLDNGPIRFTAALDFESRDIDGESMTESRIISLDKGSYLNHCTVDFKGLSPEKEIAVGFPLRDDAPALAEETGTIVYSDPTTGEGNGRILVGLVVPAGFSRTAQREGHILGYRPAGTAPYDYYWGYAWDREDIKNLQDWKTYIDNYAVELGAPLQIEVK